MDPTVNYSGIPKRRNGPRQTPPFRGVEIPKPAKKAQLGVRYNSLYPLIGVAPPSVRRAAATDAERTKQETDARYLHQHEPAGRRLRLRKSFMARSHTLEESIENNRVTRWTQQLTTRESPRDEMAPGKHLPFAVWKSLNRVRCKTNLLKWGISEDDWKKGARARRFNFRKTTYVA
ncbi:hypothetical protein QE152_g30137 [Popillia japonica]|uniref:Uncharacterized protein n=1 Tax=Popillia japonica TaxID=7064 RepID=A0AAW1JFF9_POPJA